jgi:hypothetical protein
MEITARRLAVELPPTLAPYLVRPVLGDPGVVPSGAASLDALLGGGFPRGRISEIVGPPSSGRTSLLLGTLACATAAGALVALVDVTEGLDPVAARAAGIRLDQCLWVRCGRAPALGLQAADALVRGRGFEVVVVDWGDLPPRALGRIPSTALVRLQRDVEATPTALLLTGLRRVAGSLATLALALVPRRVEWHRGGPGLLAAVTAEARLTRARRRSPGASTSLTWGLLHG